MPVSTSAHISTALRHIIPLDPKRVLDVGCGFGLWGYLCRTYLDVFNGRVQPEDWQVRIDGIELFEPYIQAHQRALYNQIQIGDIRSLAKEIPAYDLIICGDVIEHLEKDEGQAVLDALYDKATGAILLNIPLGEEGWEHPEAYGNPGELHRSQWRVEDFRRFPSLCTEIPLQNGHYGVFFFEKGRPVEERLVGLLTTAYEREKEGETALALNYARRAAELAPADPDGIPLLVDLLLRSEASDEALKVLKRALEYRPDQAKIRLLLCKILRLHGQKAEAVATLEQVLQSQTPLAPELQLEAEVLHKQLL